MSSVLNNPSSPVTPEEVVRVLRALREQIPGFALMSRSDKQSLVTSANVDPQLVQSSINAVGASESLRGFIGRSAEEMQADVELTARWSAVADEVRAFLRGIDVVITVRRHRTGLTALQVYKASVQLVRNKEHAHLLPHVEVMKRRSKFVNRRRGEPAQPEPSPGPQPEPLLQTKQQ